MPVEKISQFLGEAKTSAEEKYVLFREKLRKVLTPVLPAKELATQVVRAALETEYGQAFTGAPFYDRMVSTIADTIVTNPELRREILSMVDPFVKEKTEDGSQPSKRKGGSILFPKPDTN
jgi:hypothetical protein